MTSWEMKLKVVDYYVFNNCQALTEHRNQSDVYVIRRSGYCAEVEIKVSRSDLVGELKVIRDVMEANKPNTIFDPVKFKTRFNKGDKWRKHEEYLFDPMRYIPTPENPKEYSQRKSPNEFYFAIPEGLLDIALAGVEGTPYGIIIEGAYGVTVAKSAKKLHRAKMIESDYKHALQRAHSESFNYRRELWDKKYLKSDII